MEMKLNALVDEVVELLGGVATYDTRQDIMQILKKAYELGYRAEFDSAYGFGYVHAMTDLEESGQLKWNTEDLRQQ